MGIGGSLIIGWNGKPGRNAGLFVGNQWVSIVCKIVAIDLE
jgi:hypothetical protein